MVPVLSSDSLLDFILRDPISGACFETRIPFLRYTQGAFGRAFECDPPVVKMVEHFGFQQGLVALGLTTPGREFGRNPVRAQGRETGFSEPVQQNETPSYPSPCRTCARKRRPRDFRLLPDFHLRGLEPLHKSSRRQVRISACAEDGRGFCVRVEMRNGFSREGKPALAER